jgi:hypothetical protein
MPKLGFDMQEGTLVRWVKTEGEEVSKGEILAEIETDKAMLKWSLVLPVSLPGTWSAREISCRWARRSR